MHFCFLSKLIREISNIDYVNFYSQKRSNKTILLGNNFLPLAFSFRSSHTRIKLLSLRNNSDRNKTGLRRFKPNSRDVLLDEQSNPWHKLPHQDTSSRHRGDKRKCRYDRLIFIILLSPRYLLSDDQIIFHSKYLVR